MGGFTVPIILVGLAVVVFGGLAIWAARYKRCKPNEVIVIYGRKRKVKLASGQEVERGYRLLSGGGAFVMPIVESYTRIGLGTFQINFEVTDTPNIDGVLVNVNALANMKVSSDPELLAAAVERLLEMNESNIEQVCRQTLEAQLRQLTGNLKIEEIIQDRVKISQQVMDTAAGDLNKLGFAVDNFLITKITDKEGYIDALGKKRTAEVKRDADIAEAEAKRETKVKTAEADRVGELALAKSQKEISDAQRDKDVAVAENAALVGRKNARIDIEAQSAGEDARAELERKKIAADMARVEADTDLQVKEKARMEAKLDATTVTTARKEAEAKVITAQGEQDSAVMTGEALRIKEEKAGEGAKARQTAEAEGRKAAAAALRAEQEAEAAGEQAHLEARAAGTSAQGKAEGAAIEAKLMAEATGLDAKNKALAKLSEGAKLIMVLEALPSVIEEFGEAGERVVGSAFEHIGAGLARIDEVKILDMGGGGNGNGSTSVTDFAMTVPGIVFGTLAKLKASGVDPQKLLGKMGIDLSGMEALLGNALKSTKSEQPTADEDAPAHEDAPAA